MEFLASLLDLIVHLDLHLRHFAGEHGAWVYGLLFAIIFVETGFVVTPFMPGDALLFAVGALCASGVMSLTLVILSLTIAAIAGNQCNFAIGRYLGPRVFKWESSRFFNRQTFDMTHVFYEKHGGWTIVVARFVPLLRSFAPFVAGVADMRYSSFTFFDVTGGALWIVSLSVAGYLFGNIPWVNAHFDKIVLALLAITLAMALTGALRGRFRDRRTAGRRGVS